MSSDTTSLKQLQTIIDVQAHLTDAALDLDGFMRLVVDAAERLTNAKGAVVELVATVSKTRPPCCARLTLPCIGRSARTRPSRRPRGGSTQGRLPEGRSVV